MVQTLQNKRSFWHTWPQHLMRYEFISGTFLLKKVTYYINLMVTIVILSAYQKLG